MPVNKAIYIIPLIVIMLSFIGIVVYKNLSMEKFENWERSYKGWFQEVVDGTNVPEIYKKPKDQWVFPY